MVKENLFTMVSLIQTPLIGRFICCLLLSSNRIDCNQIWSFAFTYSWIHSQYWDNKVSVRTRSDAEVANGSFPSFSRAVWIFFTLIFLRVRLLHRHSLFSLCFFLIIRKWEKRSAWFTLTFTPNHEIMQIRIKHWRCPKIDAVDVKIRTGE